MLHARNQKAESLPHPWVPIPCVCRSLLALAAGSPPSRVTLPTAVFAAPEPLRSKRRGFHFRDLAIAMIAFLKGHLE